jgi:phosphoribosyl-AMP cyclohydrolase
MSDASANASSANPPSPSAQGPQGAGTGPSTPPSSPSQAELGALLDVVKFDEKGLVGCIVQDAANGEVLMFAFMNRESLGLTLQTGKATYWSRSRKKLWLKGESSGHFQFVREIRIDCDADAILIKVDQEGGACHTGYRSCFYRKLDAWRWREDGSKVFDASAVYSLPNQ